MDTDYLERATLVHSKTMTVIIELVKLKNSVSILRQLVTYLGT